MINFDYGKVIQKQFYQTQIDYKEHMRVSHMIIRVSPKLMHRFTLRVHRLLIFLRGTPECTLGVQQGARKRQEQEHYILLLFNVVYIGAHQLTIQPKEV